MPPLSVEEERGDTLGGADERTRRIEQAMEECGWTENDGEDDPAPLTAEEGRQLAGRLLQVHVPVTLDSRDNGEESWWWYGSFIDAFYPPRKNGAQGQAPEREIFLGSRVQGIQGNGETSATFCVPADATFLAILLMLPGAAKVKHRVVYGATGSSMLLQMPMNQLYMAFEVLSALPAEGSQFTPTSSQSNVEEDGFDGGQMVDEEALPEDETSWERLRRLAEERQRAKGLSRTLSENVDAPVAFSPVGIFGRDGGDQEDQVASEGAPR